MFLLKTDFRNRLLLMLVITVVIGSGLVVAGSYISDNYFSGLVSSLVGDYGEYDLLFTLNQDKEDLALEQIESARATSLPESQLEPGPRVAGSSNYLLKLPEKYRSEDVYSRLDQIFADIPGLMSRTIISEPRLSLRGFRGNSQEVIRPLLEEIAGIDFLYASSDGFDVIVNRPEQVPEVREEINQLLDDYRLFELRYPLDQQPDDVERLRRDIETVISGEFPEMEAVDISENISSDHVSLLQSLKQMRTFLLSYAARVELAEVEEIDQFPVGRQLQLDAEEVAGEEIVLTVVDNDGQRLIALPEQELENIESGEQFAVYEYQPGADPGQPVGQGYLEDPRYDLSRALGKLDEIVPALDDFIEQSEELVAYSQELSQDLGQISVNLSNLEETGNSLNSTLQEWQENDLSGFLLELTEVLDDVEENFGDINQVQQQLIITGNRLRAGARLIEERIVYIPRNNELYRELEQLQELFLEVAGALDENYDLVTERLDNMGPLMGSLDEWQDKISSLLSIEDTLSGVSGWYEVETIIEDINSTLQVIDTSFLQSRLDSIQQLLQEINTSQLPVVLDQLQHIQTAIPEMDNREIIETIELIDEYIAGEVIPGEQIQIMLTGEYSQQRLREQVQELVQNPAVNYLDMDIGVLQPNPRGEVFNVLQQVNSVIAILIAFVFTLLVMILDQSLLISVINLNGGRGYLYGPGSGALLFSMIYLVAGIDFPYLSLAGVLIIGALLGIIASLLSGMLNPVSREEWEAGKALGFSTGEIMAEIVIPAGKPGLLYLFNYPRMIFKGRGEGR